MAPVFSSPTRFGEYERRQIRAFPVSAAGREPMMGAPTTSNQGPDYTPTCNVMLFIVVNAAVCCVCVCCLALIVALCSVHHNIGSLLAFLFFRLQGLTTLLWRGMGIWRPLEGVGEAFWSGLAWRPARETHLGPFGTPKCATFQSSNALPTSFHACMFAPFFPCP